MKLRLRIGRQQARAVEAIETEEIDRTNKTVEADRTFEASAAFEAGTTVEASTALEPSPAVSPAPATSTGQVPLPRTAERVFVRVGSFCRVTDIGRTAVTETGRAVLAVRAGRCGRWVYNDRA